MRGRWHYAADLDRPWCAVSQGAMQPSAWHQICSLVENIGGMLGVVSPRVQGDLERFKAFIESQSIETGAWQGISEQSRTCVLAGANAVIISGTRVCC